MCWLHHVFAIPLSNACMFVSDISCINPNLVQLLPVLFLVDFELGNKLALIGFSYTYIWFTYCLLTTAVLTSKSFNLIVSSYWYTSSVPQMRKILCAASAPILNQMYLTLNKNNYKSPKHFALYPNILCTVLVPKNANYTGNRGANAQVTRQ